MELEREQINFILHTVLLLRRRITLNVNFFFKKWYSYTSCTFLEVSAFIQSIASEYL